MSCEANVHIPVPCMLYNLVLIKLSITESEALFRDSETRGRGKQEGQSDI
jgi:hypothetical protein